MEKKTYRPISNSILDAVGNTPLIRLNKIPQEEGVECEILVKCEFMNPTGSHKDRMAQNIFDDAEKSGKLKPGGTIIEATGGNTGLSLAFVASQRRYKSVILSTSHTSQEKIDLMKGYGADVIIAKNTLFKGPDGLLAITQKFHENIPNSYLTLQFENMAGPLAHYITTGEELIEQTGGKIDYFFMAMGTGSTISGTGKKLKERIPGVRVIGCDPVGSLISMPDGKGTYVPVKTEGVGLNFIPNTTDKSVIDDWMRFLDKDAFLTTRRLMRDEGIMCGGSGGGILWSAMEYAKKNHLTKNQRLVVILPDTGRNYLTKIINNEWMFEYGFITEAEYRKITMEDSMMPEKRSGDDIPIKDVAGSEIKILKLDSTIQDAWNILKKDYLLLLNATGNTADEGFKGIVFRKDILRVISTGKFKMEDKLSAIMKLDFALLKDTIKLSTVGKMLESRDYVLYKREDNKKVIQLTSGDVMVKLSEMLHL